MILLTGWTERGSLGRLLEEIGVNELVAGRCVSGRYSGASPDEIEKKVYERDGYEFPLWKLGVDGEQERIVIKSGGAELILEAAFWRHKFFIMYESSGISDIVSIAQFRRNINLPWRPFIQEASRKKGKRSFPRIPRSDY